MATPITYRQLSLALRFCTALFPFDTARFLNVLQTAGYVVLDQIAEVPFGARIEISGIVARRADVSVRVDGDKQILGVHCPNPAQAVDELSALEALVSKEFGLDFEKNVLFYELLATGEVKAAKNPQAQWQHYLSTAPVIEKMSGVLGKKVYPYGLRLVPQGTVPTSENWFEIRIEPTILSPENLHSLQVVFRNPRRDEVYEFVRRFETLMHELLGVIET